MNSKMILALAVMAGTTTALAAPRETVDVVAANGGNALIGNHLITNVAQTEPVNSVVNITITGDSGGAYTAKSVRVVGNIAAWGVNSYGSETRVRVTAPSGEFVDFSPSSLAATPAGPVSFDLSANLAPATTAGNWVVTIHETFDDASVDATYDILSVTTDDAVLPVGEPGAFTDLGDFTLAARTVDEVINLGAANEVRWFKMKLPNVLGTSPGYVDMWATQVDPTVAITANDLTDTDLALYAASSAALVTYNDATGPGLFGQLSYGSTVSRGITTATGQTNGAARNGVNGALSEGFYYLAVAQYNMAHPANISNNWGAVTSSYTGAARNTALHIRSLPNTAPFPPSGVGAANPAAATTGSPVLLTVTVTPGGNPVNTVFTVSTDLSSIGGSATQQFFDNGTNGDVTAGDSIFSYSYMVPGATAENSYTLPFTVTDGLSRSGNGSIAISVDSAGATLETANIPQGSGELASLAGNLVANDVDIFKINICDLANFTATTFGGTTADTRLFLFSPDGMGVTYNDDVPTGFPGDATLQSRISNANVTATGDYYLAVTRYQIMASDAGGNNLWITGAPFDTEVAPNGAGAASPLAQWTGAAVTQTAVTYTVALTGACYPGAGPTQCSAADVGMAGGEPGQDNLLDNNDFIAFINFFFAQDPIADQGMAGGEYGSDSLWDNNDFIAFINHFFEDTANCNG